MIQAFLRDLSVTHQDIVRAVINETLRLFPPVPLNIRETRQSGCVLPRSDATYPEAAKPPPLYMPARTTFLITPLLTQRNPSLWGDDADEFNPDRWIDPQRSAKISANPAMYTPFGAGPRLVSHCEAFPIINFFTEKEKKTTSASAKVTLTIKCLISSFAFSNSSMGSHWRLRRNLWDRNLLRYGSHGRVVSRLSGYGQLLP